MSGGGRGGKGMRIVEKLRREEQQCSRVRAGGELWMGETKIERGVGVAVGGEKRGG